MSQSGMPLLSGPPQHVQGISGNSSACRKCNKEFNVIFARSKKCQHCGYLFCATCSDYQALMPRYGVVSGVEAGTDVRSAPVGYDVVHVCAFCIEFLQITAGGKNYLKSLPLSKLRKYAHAYNIRIDHAIEKEDVIEAVLSARGPNGCLPLENERYYTKYSVPDRTAGGSARPRGLFSRSGENYTTNTRSNSNVPPRPPMNSRPEFARPDLEPDPPNMSPPEREEQYNQYQGHHTHPPPPPPPPRPDYSFHQSYSHTHYHSPSPPPPPSYRSSWGYSSEPDYHSYGNQPTYQYAYTSHSHNPPPPPPQNPPPPETSTRPTPPHPQYQTRPRSSDNIPPSSQSANTQPRPRSQSQRQSAPPTLDALLSMDPDDIRSLSISALKALLFSNHVNFNATMVLEKSDLVERVLHLVENEKGVRERARRANEEEEELFRESMREADRESEGTRREAEAEHEYREEDEDERTPSPHLHPGVSSSPPLRPTSASSRSPPRTSYAERNGLCVVCQDDEANIAIVDCGHLAMCRGCSDLVMASSRECPLCRTRIVTEARLLRIFKT